MPEYLAPGVYVEEIDTGSKPIEGVSTSTAGMLGVTERGPVNVPILITGIGEYTRWFGERLNLRDFSNGIGPHCYLPQAVEGFFINGGKRVYITRVLDVGGATPALFALHNRGTNTSAWTMLLRPAAELTGVAATPLYVLNVNAAVPNTGTLANGDRIRIGSGSETEYRIVDTITAAGSATHVPLSFPLSRGHDAAAPAHHIPRTPIPLGGGTLSLSEDAEVGDQTITVVGSDVAAIGALAVTQILEIGPQFGSEHRFLTGITSIDATHAQLQLDSPLTLRAPATTSVVPLDSLDLTAAPVAGGTKTLDVAARPGDRVVFVLNRAPAFTDREELVILDNATPAVREVRRIGSLGLLTLSTGAYGGYPAGTIVHGVSLGDDTTVVAKALTAAAMTGSTVIALDNRVNLIVGDILQIGVAPSHEFATVAALPNPSPGRTAPNAGNVVLTHPLNATHALGTAVRRQTPPRSDDPSVAAKSLTADVAAGVTAIPVDNRDSLNVGDVIRVGVAPNHEFATITGLPNPVPTPNAGIVELAHPLVRAHALGAEVRRQLAALVRTDRPGTSVVLDVANAGTLLAVTDGGATLPAPDSRYASGDVIRVTTGAGDVTYHSLTANMVSLDARPVSVTVPLARPHAAGAPMGERARLLTVQALDVGAWGNRLRVSVEDELPGLVARTTLTQSGPATRIRLASSAGVEAGSVLELLDPATEAPVGDPLKVIAVDRSTNDVTLDPGLSGPQQAAIGALPPGMLMGVRSREFRLTVYLLRQPDPAMPSRNDTLLDTEVFRYLSMDSRHSRYVQTIIGDVNGPPRLSDHRPEGESWYVRVRDVAQDLAEPARTTALESIRLGPETLIDILPDGRQRAARHPLEGGNDSIATLTDGHYIGVDDPDPENRTGLQSLRNIEEVSIVACPGRTTPAIQSALITHCELMRYRFAVLDGQRPPNDTLADVQNQRQQFDTKYAALYHPWLLIPDPYPTNLMRIAEYPIPPSGHVLGIYARTDIERGVHKAPANEVVRGGLLGLQRVLNKEQHDILNPYPVNINVIRDFRPNNRGIRVFGGRVITSDSDWKYVNVRRLLIFIEHSIDRGLQWVVFEPNAEPLWARVRRSISNFLTLVWRNGGLEGTKVEEAYFVKCDRTTMTQTDIDSGRLIVIVGVAPVKPAEFVIIRIGLWTARAEN
jgi:uncharacterized protein